MRVVGRGTLTVDVSEVMATPKFKEYQKQARQLILNKNKSRNNSIEK